MKLIEIDWHDFFRRLEVWQRLSTPARAAFARMQPSQPQSLTKFMGDHPILVEAGFLTLNKGGKNLRVNKECWPFVKTLRLIVGDDLLGNACFKAMHKYVTYQLHVNQREALCASMGLNRWQTEELIQLAMSVRWLETFLALSESDVTAREVPSEQPSYSTWSSLRHSRTKPLPKRPAVPLETMKAVVRRFIACPEPIPIAELPSRMPELSADTLVGAVAMGVDRLLLFPGVRHDDMTLVLGLWPSITQRLHQPKPTIPTAVQPEQTFHGAYLLEDMTTVLVAASGKPIRLRCNDLAIFAQTAREIAANLMPVPQWVGLPGKSAVRARIDAATRWLRAMKLLRYRSKGGSPQLEPTRRAAEWLSHTPKSRLKTILDSIRPELSAQPSLERFPRLDDDEEGVYFDGYDLSRSPRTAFLPFRMELATYSPTIPEMTAALATAFGTVPEGHFWPVDAFLVWRSQEQNPRQKACSAARSRHAYRAMTDEVLERQWAQNLADFLHLRLVPLGGARLGTARDATCFTLTAAGRYLLGLAEDFDYGHDHDAQRALVVQPNFEIVFLSPSPLAEATLARFAERKGCGIGALFGITKKSILAAAGSGMTAAQVLDSLERLSAKPIPANVAREIAGWFDQCRSIAVRSAVLIHCPDADTAARVVAVGGKQATALTDTVVELADTKAKTAVLRKLRGLGIFNRKSPQGSGSERE